MSEIEEDSQAGEPIRCYLLIDNRQVGARADDSSSRDTACNSGKNQNKRAKVRHPEWNGEIGVQWNEAAICDAFYTTDVGGVDLMGTLLEKLDQRTAKTRQDADFFFKNRSMRCARQVGTS